MPASRDRPVWLAGGDALAASGRGRASLAASCLGAPPAPLTVRLHSVGGEIEVPYFRTAVARSALPGMTREIACAALEQAGLDPGRRARLGLFVGTSSGGMARHEQAFGALPDCRTRVPIMHPDQSRPAGELHAALALGGPHYTISTACSSAANALLYATWMLREGLLDDALVVGLEMENRLSLQGFNSLLLTTRKTLRPFDAERDGIVLGECIAALVLSTVRPAGAAWRLRGGGTLCDTTHPTNPSSGKIAETMRMALDDAGIAPRQLVAIKAHGTGTRSNDHAEGQGMIELFGRKLPPFTSIKPVFGHTLGACGAIETLALTACLDEGQLPPTLNFRTVDAELGLQPATAPTPIGNGPVLLNYFGFGGNNCTLVLEREAG